MDRMMITIEGGAVQEITGIPDNLRVEVRDFDMEGKDTSEATKVASYYGPLAIISKWA